MKIKIDEDEWYPVYSEYSYGTEIEVTPAFAARFRAASKEFNAVQRMMKRRYYKERPIRPYPPGSMTMGLTPFLSSGGSGTSFTNKDGELPA